MQSSYKNVGTERICNNAQKAGALYLRFARACGRVSRNPRRRSCGLRKRFYAVLSVAGAFLIIFGWIVFLSDALKNKKILRIIIAYENGVLHFPDFDCTADKIVEVRGEGRLYHGVRHRWGKSV